MNPPFTDEKAVSFFFANETAFLPFSGLTAV
jgi:hypothetical protein